MRWQASAPWPNPSRGALSFALLLDRADEVRLALFDVSGRQVAATAPTLCAAGSPPVSWAPVLRRGGLYFVRIQTASGDPLEDSGASAERAGPRNAVRHDGRHTRAGLLFC